MKILIKSLLWAVKPAAILSPSLIGMTLLTTILLCSGCGQKGQLYLPDASDSQAVIIPSAKNLNLDDLTDANAMADDKLNVIDPAIEQQILAAPNDY